MKQIYKFLEDIGPVAFSLLLIGAEVTAGLMFLCAVLPLCGQTELYFLAQNLGDIALRVLWGSVLAAFVCYIFSAKSKS